MKFRLISILSLLPALSFGQSAFEKRFSEAAAAGDTSAMRRIVVDWEASGDLSPEMFIAKANSLYYAAYAGNIVLSAEAPETGALAFKFFERMDSSRLLPARYVHEDEVCVAEPIKRAAAVLDEGIARYPLRLDMHFGKTYIFSTAEPYTSMIASILVTFRYASKAGNGWLWSKNEAIKDPERVLTDYIRCYISRLFDEVEDDELLAVYMRAITGEMLKVYPENVPALTDLAISRMLAKNDAKALEYLLRAERLAPDDVVVLAVMAECYRRMGRYDSETDCYRKLLDSSDEKYREFGRRRLKQAAMPE